MVSALYIFLPYAHTHTHSLRTEATITMHHEKSGWNPLDSRSKKSNFHPFILSRLEVHKLGPGRYRIVGDPSLALWMRFELLWNFKRGCFTTMAYQLPTFPVSPFVSGKDDPQRTTLGPISFRHKEGRQVQLRAKGLFSSSRHQRFACYRSAGNYSQNWNHYVLQA